MAAFPLSWACAPSWTIWSAKTPLPLYLDLPMALAWLGFSLLAGVLASLGAGLKAARITVRETPV